MSDVKICNLDVIAPVQQRELVLNGKTFEIKPLSVQLYIKLKQYQVEMAKSTKFDEGYEISKKAIKAACPSFDDSLFDMLTMQQLSMIMAFIIDELPDEKLKAEAPEQATNDKKDETDQGK